ncbi:hypothetical protein TOPH_08889 [Tolypocladium ophioglossoides CBS 100239]|uniref:Uncharacterized protein n=1 Tax=Tolypocladium ophioglossoides (strain CBS 100239) TaxID=1163406 RepID=A0A0L0MXH1_TOLOC|nr:hypothetical protein TOPH_08889 [Tolypocladium ophioglossoides CBS 100239]
MSSQDKTASCGGRGTLEALREWEICVPTDLLERAETLLKSQEYASLYTTIPPPLPQPASLIHTYTHFQCVGLRAYFVLVPSDDIHIDCRPSIFQRSFNGLPYPRLIILIQSFLDAGDLLSLCDVVDGSNVSEEWGSENLDLEGDVDLEWIKRKNEAIKQSRMGKYAKGAPAGMIHVKCSERRALWESIVRTKGARRGWTQPEEIFSTRFRLHGSPDPWLEHRQCS